MLVNKDIRYVIGFRTNAVWRSIKYFKKTLNFETTCNDFDSEKCRLQTVGHFASTKCFN